MAVLSLSNAMEIFGQAVPPLVQVLLAGTVFPIDLINLLPKVLRGKRWKKLYTCAGVYVIIG